MIQHDTDTVPMVKMTPLSLNSLLSARIIFAAGGGQRITESSEKNAKLDTVIREWELLDEKSLKSLDTVPVDAWPICRKSHHAAGLPAGVRTQPEIVPFPQTGDGRNGNLGD